MSLISKAVQEKNVRIEKRKENIEFYKRFLELFEPFTYEIVGYFGDEMVRFKKEHGLEFEIDRNMCQYSLKIKSKENGIQMYFKTHHDITHGIPEQDLETINKDMSDEEIKDKIENSLMYLLNRVL